MPFERPPARGTVATGVKQLALSVVSAAVIFAIAPQVRAADEFAYDTMLATVARETLWQSASEDGRVAQATVLRVSVRCYHDRHAFEQTFERRFGTPARRVVAYYAGGRNVHLRNGTCTNVHAFLGGRHTVLTAGAIAILLHESLHRQRVLDERLTTCFANESVRWGALWYGFADATALRARNLAFTYTRLYAPQSYRMGKPNCLALTRRESWVDST
jgi:hypothetical protein